MCQDVKSQSNLTERSSVVLQMQTKGANMWGRKALVLLHFAHQVLQKRDNNAQTHSKLAAGLNRTCDVIDILC